jgi:hypothetical protein
MIYDSMTVKRKLFTDYSQRRAELMLQAEPNEFARPGGNIVTLLRPNN